MQFLNAPTCNLYFTGDGGVGTNVIACATAVRLADRRLHALLIPTDLASILDGVLGTQLTNEPAAIAVVYGLFAMNIDPEESARVDRECMVGLTGVFCPTLWRPAWNSSLPVRIP